MRHEAFNLLYIIKWTFQAFDDPRHHQGLLLCFFGDAFSLSFMLTQWKAFIVFAEENAVKIRKTQLYRFWWGRAKMETFKDPSTKMYTMLPNW